jgi:hypothetical protein
VIVIRRLATWAFYAVGALAIAYLALYAYAVFTGRDLQPGDPIRIFRKPDAPSYSGISTSLRAERSNPPLRLWRYGLLRSARNDEERSLPTPPRQTAARPRPQA